MFHLSGCTFFTKFRSAVIMTWLLPSSSQDFGKKIVILQVCELFRWNRALNGRSMKFGTWSENVLWMIFGYRAIQDLFHDRNGRQFSKWSPKLIHEYCLFVWIMQLNDWRLDRVSARAMLDKGPWAKTSLHCVPS